MDFIRYKDELISIGCIKSIRLHEGSKYTILLEDGRHVEIPVEWKESVDAFLEAIDARIHILGPHRSPGVEERGEKAGPTVNVM